MLEKLGGLATAPERRLVEVVVDSADSTRSSRLGSGADRRTTSDGVRV